MKKEDFYIGLEFYTATGKWLCTDIGTRVIVAIKIETGPKAKKGSSWYNGPPYTVAEHVFDEYDFAGCSLTSK